MLIKRYIPKPSGKSFLEVGCGTGVVIRTLEDMGFTTTGLDVNAKALAFAKIGTHAKFIRQSFHSLIHTGKYHALGMFDVLEHQKDDQAFLRKANTLLRPGGYLFITVPALHSLWNDADTLAGHQRRYTQDGIIRKVEHAGFTVKFVNYWQFVLLPLYILFRAYWQMKPDRDMDMFLHTPAEPVNTILHSLLYIERFFLFRIRIPIGSSLILAAEKRA